MKPCIADNASAKCRWWLSSVHPRRRWCLSFAAAVMVLSCLRLPESCGQDLSKSKTANHFRLADDRPKLDPVRLKNLGLNVFRSRHLILVTDVPAEDVQDLPPLADALFAELQRQCGTLAPDPAQTEFQVTGYLIGAKERFETAGLLPPEQFEFRHGRHLGYQFWMNNQTSPYYRRHLMLHEFVHCFMMCEYGMRDIPPLRYTEGIAEYFATHQLESDVTKSRFGILPPSLNGFEGWGRITEIRNALTAIPENAGDSTSRCSLEKILHPADTSFTDDLRYAEAWALVWLIRNHPELRTKFSGLAQVRTIRSFRDAEQAVPADAWKRLAVEWPLFLDSLTEGFDTVRSFPAPTPESVPWSDVAAKPLVLSILADRDWQSVGVIFKPGQTVTLTCSGRYAVHDKPRPWISEPQGITIDYYRGHPLGKVVAMVVSTDARVPSKRITVGIGRTLTFDDEAELWLQINDSAARRAGNSGSVTVQIQ